MSAYDTVRDPATGSATLGFTSGFNTYSLGHRREWNPLEAVRRNWEDRPSSPQAGGSGKVVPPSTASPAGRASSPAGRAFSPARVRASSAARSASPRRRRSAAAPARASATDVGDDRITQAKVLSPPPTMTLPATASTALPSTAPPPQWAAAPGPREFVGLEQAAGHLRVIVPQPLDGAKLGLTVKHLVVATVTDPRALDFGWALGDQILKVNGVPVADTRALSTALAGALNAWRAVGQAMVFDVWRPPGSRMAGGPGGPSYPASPPPGQDFLQPPLAGPHPPMAGGSGFMPAGAAAPTSLGGSACIPPDAGQTTPGIPPGAMQAPPYPPGPAGTHPLQGPGTSPAARNQPSYSAWPNGMPPSQSLPDAMGGWQSLGPGTHANAFSTQPLGTMTGDHAGLAHLNAGLAHLHTLPPQTHHDSVHAAGLSHPGTHAPRSARRNFSKRRLIC
mmetsp:Transcript_179526/g.436799  ORF Transcript_179526/g.436799 Transcript_179526/m.436799 type:complete len:449 (+) Transcript_179526:39-1385(+)